MVDVSGGSNNIKINVASKNNLKQIVVSPDALQHYTNLARGWANKLDSTVDGVEYSAKYYAQKAQASSEDSINAKNSILNNSGFIAVSADLIGDNNIGTCASNIETILSASSNAIAAQNYAQTAAAQAEIATTKAQEATAAVTDYADKKIRYADFPEMIDRILCKIVEKNVALEINTSSAGSGSLLLPDLDIIARYTALGGRMFTFGSDAHTVARYCDKEEIVKSALSDLDIKRCCYFEKGKIVWAELA